jgi:uridine kinase
VRALREAGEDCLQVRLDDWIMPAAERRPGDSAELRNRVAELQPILTALRRGEAVTAPGYDAVRRVQGKPVTYDPAGRTIIVIEGVFAAHLSARHLLDVAAFVDAPEPLQRRRFAALYRWKGFDDAAMEELWETRRADEWAAVDAQREHCNVIITASGP